MKCYLKQILFLYATLLFIGCSSVPDWLSNKWDLISYGNEPQGLFGDINADALGKRFYWEIHGNTIDGYMQEGWQGSIISLFSDNTKPTSNSFEKRTNCKFNIISSTSNECQIELIDGTELYPIASMVTPREVNPGEIIFFRRLNRRRIAMDRKVNLNENSVQNQAANMLMQQSSSLIEVNGDTYHRLILGKSQK